jgi:pSer/pThr/pTyr-binding forkhead associated (FHA) protein
MHEMPAPPIRAVLVGLTPEACAALGGRELAITRLPFRVGRDSRVLRHAGASVVPERRRSRTPPNNELYLAEADGSAQVSREHFLIEHNGAHFVLVDRQSAQGTIVEGTVVGGRHVGGAAPLRGGDVIIVGRSGSPFVFKFLVP